MVQAVIVLGMGPVEPEFRGTGQQRRLIIANPRMRHNAIATKELVVNGYIDLHGFIVPTGGTTAKAQLVEEAYRQHLINGPQTEEEKRQVLQTSEAELMGSFIKKVVVKSNVSSQIPQEILLESEASNTLENFICSLNLLDRKVNGLFNGQIAVVGSNFGHLTRVSEIAKALGLDQGQMVFLSSEQILRHFDYDSKYLDEFLPEKVKLEDIQMHERWLLGIQKIPEYVLPEIKFVENDERFMQMMKELRTYYGTEVLGNIAQGLDHFETMQPKDIRDILGSMKRKLPPKNWGISANPDVWRERMRVYNKNTENWLTHKFI